MFVSVGFRFQGLGFGVLVFGLSAFGDPCCSKGLVKDPRSSAPAAYILTDL